MKKNNRSQRKVSKKAGQTQPRPRASASAARFNSEEFKLVSLRECPFRDGEPLVYTPKDAADYWRQHISTEARFNPQAESLVLLMLNTRRRLIGHVVLSQGTKNQLLLDSGEVLRPAVIAGAAAVVLMHNHPSGDPCPSANDIKATQKLREAGALLEIEVCDHVILGKPSVESARDFASLREIGYFGPLKDDETAAEKPKAQADTLTLDVKAIPKEKIESAGHIVDGNIWFKLGLNKSEGAALKAAALRLLPAGPHRSSAQAAHWLLRAALAHFNQVHQMLDHSIRYAKAEGLNITDHLSQLACRSLNVERKCERDGRSMFSCRIEVEVGEHWLPYLDACLACGKEPLPEEGAWLFPRRAASGLRRVRVQFPQHECRIHNSGECHLKDNEAQWKARRP